jgi:glyoxylase-like metal-dependent hydrolase (beta-lactamase superfamily II)
MDWGYLIFQFLIPGSTARLSYTGRVREILPGLYCFEGLVLGRVYAIEDADGLTIMDAGLSFAPYVMAREMKAAGRSLRDVRRIVVTHGHPDHAGGLRRLWEITGAQVVASVVERPVLEGRRPMPSKPVSKMRQVEKITRPPRVWLKGTPVARVVGEGDVLREVMGGLRVIETPGHTMGHLSFWQPEIGVLFCGDVIAAGLGMRLPSRAWTVDMDENRRSVGRLARLRPEMVCFGHGKPLMTDTARALEEFAERVSL